MRDLTGNWFLKALNRLIANTKEKAYKCYKPSTSLLNVMSCMRLDFPLHFFFLFALAPQFSAPYQLIHVFLWIYDDNSNPGARTSHTWITYSWILILWQQRQQLEQEQHSHSPKLASSVVESLWIWGVSYLFFKNFARQNMFQVPACYLLFEWLPFPSIVVVEDAKSFSFRFMYLKHLFLIFLMMLNSLRVLLT